MKIEHLPFDFHGSAGGVVERRHRLAEIRSALKRSRVTALLGPRQAGKTTLARQIVPPDSPSYFDLEAPRSLARLAEPMTALPPRRGVVVIDEIQRRPDLFPVPRVLADRRPLPARFLILGSATPDLLRQSSETLAGRLETITLMGFGLDEVGPRALDRHWRRGGFPPAYLARSRESRVAPAVHPHVSRTRPSPARRHHPGHHPVPLLDHARPLPRRDLERCRGPALAWQQRAHGPALPRPP